MLQNKDMKGAQDKMNLDIASLLAEAREAVACLRADELEVLVLRCEALARAQEKGKRSLGRGGEIESGKVRRELALFEEAIESTRENLNVLLRGCRPLDRLEYGPVESGSGEY